MPAPYPAAGIANALINKAAEDKQTLSHMKLQKLLYYAAGYYIAASDTPLIDRKFEAWDYGPVVPSLYQQFKKYGDRPVKPALTYDFETEEFVQEPIPTGDKRLDKVLDFVWKSYGKYPATTLSDMTHADGTPWDKTRKANPGIRDADIPNNDLKAHFIPHVKRRAS